MLKILETRSEGNLVPVLDELIREGARRLLMVALENEVAEYVEAHTGEKRGGRSCSDGAQGSCSSASGDDRRRHDGDFVSAGQRPAVRSSLRQQDPAAVHAALAEGGGGVAVAVPARSVDG